MSAEEAVNWQAYMRQTPHGFGLINTIQATLHRAITIAGRDGRSKNVPKLEAFLFQPPSPLLADRLEREAEATGKRKKRPRTK